ncbi:Glycoside hydrolase superfamily [Acididesulfobacillus acetoxydans]|uniref:Glycoside hydrolase superfamily n=1 Tax=Acididesulfobacillus acetoxydans TaxID=1561005 RepID=A0A8S0W464_9FIRM|nr:glycosyl hydrolase family 18 protein [Acididesulfobacillus acetoxydans]CAA7602278.1 Glycoside hydrolase superfamily [Acididesulfobacillus acetoxydans]
MALKALAFYNGLDERAGGFGYLERYGSLLTYLAVFQIGIESNGQLNGRVSPVLIQEAHHMGVKVLPVFSNIGRQGQFSVPVLSRLMRDSAFSDLVWQNIRNSVLSMHCYGVNLDLERARSEDRALFTRFLNDWGQRFQREKLAVTLNVPAKTSDEPQKAWSGVFDYTSISQNMNAVIVMAYEEHWPGSPPGSVASLPWVTAVVDYALENMPADKIFLGLGLYGYDWSERGGARALSYRRALEIAGRYRAPLHWDAQQHSTYFTYETTGVRHTVYFEDPRSTGEKLDLAQDRGLAGVAIWDLDLSYPEFWEVLRRYV